MDVVGDNVKVRIDLVIEQAQALVEQVDTRLPAHEGLKGAARLTLAAARKAKRVTAGMKRPWSPHRGPLVFVALAFITLLGWLWWQFFHVSTLTLAVPESDAVALRDSVAQQRRLQVQQVVVPGSREASGMVARGEVDVAFVQGGVPIAPGLLRLESPGTELLFFFLREGVPGPAEVKTILTSLEGEGSHSVGQAVTQSWGLHEVRWRFDFRALAADATAHVPADVDAVLVVKDPADESALRAAERLEADGFRLADVPLGVRASRFRYLKPMTLPAGGLRVEPPFPPRAVETYAVSTFLVAREGLTPRLLTQAAHMLDSHTDSLAARTVEFTTGETSELFQGVDAFLSIILNIVLAFLALMGLDVVAYRRPFHELNSLVSVLSMLQSNKDVLGPMPDAVRVERLLYLGLCADVLTLISSISGFYTQENSSLLFNSLSQVVHARSDALKLNIQIKVLHAMVPGLVQGR